MSEFVEYDVLGIASAKEDISIPRPWSCIFVIRINEKDGVRRWSSDTTARYISIYPSRAVRRLASDGRLEMLGGVTFLHGMAPRMRKNSHSLDSTELEPKIEMSHKQTRTQLIE
jgi:hypothetical protein